MFSSSNEVISEKVDTCRARTKVEYGLIKYDETFFGVNTPYKKELKKVNALNSKSESSMKFQFTHEELEKITKIDAELDMIQIQANELGRRSETLEKLKEQITLSDDPELANKLNSAFNNRFSIKVEINRESKLLIIEIGGIHERQTKLRPQITDYIERLTEHKKIKLSSTETELFMTLNLFERDNILSNIGLIEPPRLTGLSFEYAQGGY
jgi:hypothetical protein